MSHGFRKEKEKAPRHLCWDLELRKGRLWAGGFTQWEAPPVHMMHFILFVDPVNEKKGSSRIGH